MKRLDPMQLAAIKHSARCPECASTVTVDDSVRPVITAVYHEAGCPALAAHEALGTTVTHAASNDGGSSWRAITEAEAGAGYRFKGRS